jgi:hypothetical protein
LWYLGLNAIAFTEQLTILLNLFVAVAAGDIRVPDTVLQNPPSVTDWFNLAQLGTTAICSAVL